MYTYPMTSRVLTRAISFALGITALPAIATDYNWIGGSGDWDTASNWDQNAVPQGGDNATIESVGDFDWLVTYSAATPEYVNALTLNATDSGIVQLDLLGSWLAVGDFVVGSNGQASAVHTGTTVFASNLVIGQSAGGVGDYLLSSGYINGNDLRLGELAGSTGTFTWTDGTLDITNLHIGQGGSGTFILDYLDGNREWQIAPHQRVVIGEEAGSNGVFEQRSGNVNAQDNPNQDNSIIVGEAGTGTYRQLDGYHNATETVIGHLAGSDGTYELSGEYARHDTQRTVVGDAGTGHYVQTAGFHFTNDLVIGQSAGGVGDYQLSGGDLETGTTIIGATAESSGTMKVIGPDAYWNNSGTVYVGASVATSIDPDMFSPPATGAALLELQDGAYMRADAVIVGETGAVRGNGVIEANVTNGGLVAPGASAGILEIFGNYTQLAEGTLSIEIGGSTFGVDQNFLDIRGDATLAGTLSVSLLSGYDFSIGESFDILFANSVWGNFDSLLFPVFNGMTFDIAYDLNTVRLTVVNAVPVPAAAWLFGSGVIALAGVSRRRKAA